MTDNPRTNFPSIAKTISINCYPKMVFDFVADLANLRASEVGLPLLGGPRRPQRKPRAPT